MQVKMTVAQFQALPEHPEQRNTEKHAVYASTRHLREQDASMKVTHKYVYAITHPITKVLHKLNGHTRALLWQQGKLTPPPVLEVTMVDVNSVEEFNHAYWEFDDPNGSKRNAQTVEGVCSSLGFFPESPALKRFKFVTALVAASIGSFHGTHPIVKGPSADRAKALRDFLGRDDGWLDILEIVDKDFCPPARTGWQGPVLMAMFMTARRYGRDPRLISFWQAVKNGQGRQAVGLQDPVQLTCGLIKIKSGDNWSGHKQILKYLACVDNYLQDPNQMHTCVRGIHDIVGWHKQMQAEYEARQKMEKNLTLLG